MSFRPRILDRLVLRDSVLPFLLGFSVVTFLFLLDFLFKYLDLLLVKGVPFNVVGELFLLALGWILALSVPCGVLVAALMVFGRMAQDNEVTSLRALGVNPAGILRAPLAASLLLTGLMVAFNHYVLPETNHRFSELMQSIHRKAPTVGIEPGVFVDAFENTSLLVQEVNDKTGDLGDITIYDYSKGRTPTTILARTGHMEYIDHGATLRIDLYDGQIHEVPGDAAEGKYRILDFDRQTLFLDNAAARMERVTRDRRGDREMNLTMLHDQIQRLEGQRAERISQVDARLEKEGFGTYEEFTRRYLPRHAGLFKAAWHLVAGAPRPDTAGVPQRLLEDVRVQQLEVLNVDRRIDNYRVEFHKKFSLPFACAVFVLLGGPLGIRLSKGGFANMFVALVFFVIYWLLIIAGEKLAERRLFSPILAMWLPNLLLGSLGIYFAASVTGLGPSRGMR